MKKHSVGVPYSKKSLGQNFLVDTRYIGAIIEAIHPLSEETIIEIGPGRGALTGRLLEKGARVAAIEFDKDLAVILMERFGGDGLFTMIHADALRVDFAKIAASMDAGPPVKLAANLPYNISTPILQRLISQSEVFSEMILMFQREVMNRITAVPGSSDRGFLTVLTETSFDVERLFDVPPTAFRPKPKVWSSVARLRPRNVKPNLSPEFATFLKTAFSQKRKTILNNLKVVFPNAEKALTIAQIEYIRRAETLSLDEWLALDAAMLQT